MLASYQDVFPTDFLPSVLKRSYVWLPVWSVCGMQRTNLVYLLHNLLFFPCSESKGPMWRGGWGSATGTAAILATVREKVCRKQWRTFTLIVQTLFHKNSTKHEMQRERFEIHEADLAIIK